MTIVQVSVVTEHGLMYKAHISVQERRYKTLLSAFTVCNTYTFMCSSAVLTYCENNLNSAKYIFLVNYLYCNIILLIYSTYVTSLTIAEMWFSTAKELEYISGISPGNYKQPFMC